MAIECGAQKKYFGKDSFTQYSRTVLLRVEYTFIQFIQCVPKIVINQNTIYHLSQQSKAQSKRRTFYIP